MDKQTILCLDMEGVLVPEIWINVAQKTGIEELKLTTRDIEDYNELMQYRLKILDKNNLKIQDIQSVIATMNPFEGCVEFLDRARGKMQVVILSDTFIEFAKPLIEKMKFPTLFCHNLTIEKDGTISNYNIRIQDQKTKAVKRFKELNFNTIAAGDSFNDTGMLLEADKGIFFKPSKLTSDKFPQLPISENYEQLKEFIIKHI